MKNIVVRLVALLVIVVSVACSGGAPSPTAPSATVPGAQLLATISDSQLGAYNPAFTGPVYGAGAGVYTAKNGKYVLNLTVSKAATLLVALDRVIPGGNGKTESLFEQVIEFQAGLNTKEIDKIGEPTDIVIFNRSPYDIMVKGDVSIVER